MVIKLVEDWSVTQLRNDVRDALQLVGEQCVLLAMRHPVTDGDAEKCPECQDDIYNDGEAGCLQCYGTQFANPIKTAAKAWAVFTDQVWDEELGQRGVWEPYVREMQTEAFPLLLQHDYVVRVRRWAPDGTIAEIEGFYGVQKVTQNSVRTGNRHGQYTWDAVGQKAVVTLLSDSVAICHMPVIGVSFPDPSVPSPGQWATPKPRFR